MSVVFVSQRYAECTTGGSNKFYLTTTFSIDTAPRERKSFTILNYGPIGKVGQYAIHAAMSNALAEKKIVEKERKGYQREYVWSAPGKDFHASAEPVESGDVTTYKYHDCSEFTHLLTEFANRLNLSNDAVEAIHRYLDVSYKDNTSSKEDEAKRKAIEKAQEVLKQQNMRKEAYSEEWATW